MSTRPPPPDRSHDLTPAAITVPALFVLLWSTGFIGARLGLPHAGPLTFLTLRYLLVLAVMAPLALLLRARWPASRLEAGQIAVAGLLIQGGYLGGVFCAIDAGMSAGVVALIVGMQPLLTAAVAGRLLGERVMPLQWAGFALGLAGVALVVWHKMSLQGMGAASLGLALFALACITLGMLYQKKYCPSFDLRAGVVLLCRDRKSVDIHVRFPAAACRGPEARHLIPIAGIVTRWSTRCEPQISRLALVFGPAPTAAESNTALSVAYGVRVGRQTPRHSLSPGLSAGDSSVVSTKRFPRSDSKRRRNPQPATTAAAAWRSRASRAHR